MSVGQGEGARFFPHVPGGGEKGPRIVPPWRWWWERLRSDYALAVLTLGGLVAVFWLIPFAFFRALQGNWVAAANDALLSVIFTAAAVYAWRTGDSRRPGWVMAVAIVGGLWAIGAVAQFAALFWAYPGVLMLFFLVPPHARGSSGSVGVDWLGSALLDGVGRHARSAFVRGNQSAYGSLRFFGLATGPLRHCPLAKHEFVRRADGGGEPTAPGAGVAATLFRPGLGRRPGGARFGSLQTDQRHLWPRGGR